MDDTTLRLRRLLKLFEDYNNRYNECSKKLCGMLRDINCYDVQGMLAMSGLMEMYDEKICDVTHQIYCLLETH